MRITAVESIPIGYPEPNDHDRTRYVCLAKVTTDEGVVGWGEGVAYWPESARAAATLRAGHGGGAAERGGGTAGARARAPAAGPAAGRAGPWTAHARAARADAPDGPLDSRRTGMPFCQVERR